MTSHSKPKPGVQLEDIYQRLVKIHGLKRVQEHLKKIVAECTADNRIKDAERYNQILNELTQKPNP